MSKIPIPNSRAEALALDAQDPLAPCREQFKLTEGLIYLVGHSLGPATHKALKAIETAAASEWAEGLVGSWNSADWINLVHRVGAQIAPLIGVPENEVVICDSVSVNLFKLAAAALPSSGGQNRIIVERDEFPTDQYIAKGLSDLAGADFDHAEPGQGISVLAKGGVLIKSAVHYRTAEIIDIKAYEAEAAKSGAVIIWDLSHATGAIALDLAGAGARLATGCTYKYLNGGPGAPAFIYARSDIAEQMRSPLPGWLGHKAPFAFSSEYEPSDGVARFVAGTPPILSLSALLGGLEVFDQVDMGALVQKTRALSGLCLHRAFDLGLKSTVPPDAKKRGGHVSLIHEQGYAIVQALKARNVHADFRTPDTVRFGFSPLFLRYVDVWDTMDALSDILQSAEWNRPEYQRRNMVT